MHDWGNYGSPGDRVADLHCQHAVGDIEDRPKGDIQYRNIDPITVEPPYDEVGELKKMLWTLFIFLTEGTLDRYKDITNPLNAALNDTNLVLAGKRTKYYK